MNAVLVTGGTGQIGVFLLPRLIRDGCRVIALSRRVRPGTVQRPRAGGGRLTWAHPEDLAVEDAPNGGFAEAVDVLVSAGPIGLPPALLARCPNLRRLVCFSSSSVLVKADSPFPPERAMMCSMAAAEQQLKDTCLHLGISLWLLRPTLIYGCGLDRNVSRLAGLARRFRVVPVAGPARGLRQPVHADDLAALAARIVTGDAVVGLESEVAGGEVLTYREMVERVFDAFGLRPRVPGLPPALLALAVRVAGALSGSAELNAGIVVRQNLDLLFDDSAVRSVLDYHPRPFRPRAADFAIPAEALALQPE